MATEAEIREDERQRQALAGGFAGAVRRNQERREEEERQRSNGLWDFFRNMFSGFGLFEMIIVGLVLGGLYLAAKANPEWAEKLTEMLPDSWQTAALGLLDKIGIEVDMAPQLTALANDMPKLKEKLTSNGVPKEVVDIIAKDKQTFDQFLSIVSEANNKTDDQGKTVKGKVNPTTFTNANTIYALITKRPEMVQQLAAVAMKPGSDAAKSETGQKIFGALKDIVADETRLTSLVTTHRATTVNILTTLATANKLPFDAAQIDALLVKQLDANGKPTPQLRTLLNAALDGDVKTALNTAIGGASTNVPPASAPALAGAANAPTGTTINAQALLTLVQRDNLSSDLQKQCYDAAKANPALFQKIVDSLGVEKLMTLMQGDPKGAMQTLLFDPQNISALPHLCEFAGKVDAVKKDLPVDPKAFGDFISQVGFKDGQPTASFKQLMAEIAKHPESFDMKVLKAPLQQFILTPEVSTNPQTLPALQAFAKTLTPKNDEEKAALADLQKLTPKMLVALSNIQKNGVDPFSLRDALGKGDDMAHALELLASKQNRDVFRKAGTDNLAVILQESAPQSSKVGVLTARNLNAVLNFVDTIETNNAANAQIRERASKVMGSLMTLVAYPGSKPFADLSPKDVSAFFSHKGNAEAVGAFLNALEIKKLPPQQQQLVGTLRDTWGNLKGGMAQVLTSEAAVKTLFGQAEKEMPVQSCKAAQNDGPAIGFVGSIFAPNLIGENVHEINRLAKSIALANCTADTAHAPAPTPVASIPPRTRMGNSPSQP